MFDWWRSLSKRRKVRFWRGASYVLFAVLAVGFVVAVDWGRVGDTMFRADLVADQFPDILLIAAKNTIIYTILGFIGGLLIGLMLALMRLSQSKPFRWVSAIYIDVVRGIPLLVWILLIGLGIPIALGIRVPTTYGPGALALSIVVGAYMAETIRAGIEAVDRGQMEAARSLGMSYSKAMIWIILPQAFRLMIPPLTNEFILLLKDTSLVSAIGVTVTSKELTRWGRDGVIHSANATPLVVAGLVYLLLTIPMTRAVAQLEKKAAQSK
ncbi:MAG: amino acid ABC transporter permease [Actinomycetota bacterium]